MHRLRLFMAELQIPQRLTSCSSIHLGIDLQAACHGRLSNGPTEQDLAGGGSPGPARCQIISWLPHRYQDRRLCGLHVSGVYAAAVQFGLQNHSRHCNGEWDFVPGGPCQLHLRPSRPLHQHRYRLLQLPSCRTYGTQGRPILSVALNFPTLL